MRIWYSSLCEVHEVGNRRLRLWWYQEEGGWKNPRDGRSLLILPVSKELMWGSCWITHQRLSHFSLSVVPSRQKKKVSDGCLFYQAVGSLTPPDLEQRCNGERPCSTCVMARSTSECIYDEEEDGHLPGLLIGIADPDVPTHLPFELNPTPSTSGTTRVTYESAALRVSKANQIPQGHSWELALAYGNAFKQSTSWDSSPSISIISSLLPPTIPPEPWISLSFLGEERFQVQPSKTDSTVLDMKLYVL